MVGSGMHNDDICTRRYGEPLAASGLILRRPEIPPGALLCRTSIQMSAYDKHTDPFIQITVPVKSGRDGTEEKGRRHVSSNSFG
jgi:hypothetical protein